MKGLHIKNIQQALRNRATIQDGVINCDGNCVTSPTVETGSIPQAPAPGYQISQNPCSYKIHFSEEVKQIRIFDLSGRLVHSGKGGSKQVIELNKQSFLSGIYLLAFTGQGVKRTSKLMIMEDELFQEKYADNPHHKVSYIRYRNSGRYSWQHYVFHVHAVPCILIPLPPH